MDPIASTLKKIGLYDANEMLQTTENWPRIFTCDKEHQKH